MIQKKLYWYNEQWNVYLTSTEGHEGWKEIRINNITKDGGIYRLSEYAVEDLKIYSFGFLTHNRDQRPGHGGEWSSNCQRINQVFDVNITEIGMDGMSAAIDIFTLSSLLGGEYIINPSPYGMSIQSVKDGEDIKNFTWRTIE